MCKTLARLMFIALALMCLCAATASAELNVDETRPGVEDGYRYFKTHPYSSRIDAYDLDVLTDAQLSSLVFGLDGCDEYEDGVFYRDASRYEYIGSINEPVGSAYARSRDMDNPRNVAYYRYKSTTSGYRLVRAGSDTYYICTLDGVYLKRKGGINLVNKPYLSYTTSRKSATKFHIEPLYYSAGYRVYEKGAIGIAALRSVYDEKSKRQILKLEYKDYKTDSDNRIVLTWMHYDRWLYVDMTYPMVTGDVTMTPAFGWDSNTWRRTNLYEYAPCRMDTDFYRQVMNSVSFQCKAPCTLTMRWMTFYQNFWARVTITDPRGETSSYDYPIRLKPHIYEISPTYWMDPRNSQYDGRPITDQIEFEAPTKDGDGQKTLRCIREYLEYYGYGAKKQASNGYWYEDTSWTGAIAPYTKLVQNDYEDHDFFQLRDDPWRPRPIENHCESTVTRVVRCNHVFAFKQSFPSQNGEPGYDLYRCDRCRVTQQRAQAYPDYSVMTRTSEHGGVAVSVSSAHENDPVSVTVSPSPGWMLASLTLTPTGGDETAIEADENGEYVFLMPANHVTVKAVFSQINYTVTLNSGGGSGEPVVFTSEGNVSSETRLTAGNCQFYYEDDGRVAFKLDQDFLPDTFTGPEYALFAGWSGNSTWNILTQAETVFTAEWEMADADYALAPDMYVLESGTNDIEMTLDELVLGKVTDATGAHLQAEGLSLSAQGGVLTDEHGNTIPFGVTGGPERALSSRDETFVIHVTIDPEDYAAAVPGAYTGSLTFDALWQPAGVPGPSRTVDLTLVVPVPPLVPHAVGTSRCTVSLLLGDGEPLSEAYIDDRLFITWDDADEPEGQYWSGVFSVDGEVLEEGLWEFDMPDHDVLVEAVYLPQETRSYDFSDGPVQDDIHDTAIYNCGEMILNEEDMTYSIDINGDGHPDVHLLMREDTDSMLLVPLKGLCALAPRYTVDLADTHQRVGRVEFIFAPAFGPADFTLPAALTAIEESAFEGDADIGTVDAAHVTAIGANAFGGCADLGQIRLPADCAIDETAFAGCGPVYVFAPAGGPTEASCAAIENCLFIAITGDE